MSAFVRAHRLPPLDPLARHAVECLSWCGGWMPERWPSYDAFHQVDDWAAVIELMQRLRAHRAQRQEP